MDTVANLIIRSRRVTPTILRQESQGSRAARPWRICFKRCRRPANPDRARTLIPVVLKAAGYPGGFHAHCNSGQAPLNTWKASSSALRILHTAIPPLANGSSQPSVFNIAIIERRWGTTRVDLKPLEPVVKHSHAVAKSDGLPHRKPMEYDEGMYQHSAGGISNMRHQLKIVGKEP